MKKHKMKKSQTLSPTCTLTLPFHGQRRWVLALINTACICLVVFYDPSAFGGFKDRLGIISANQLAKQCIPDSSCTS